MLIRMGEGSYRSFFEVAVKSYAEDNVASGRWSAQDSLALAQAETERLLPQGHATQDNYLFEIREKLGRPAPRIPVGRRAQPHYQEGGVYLSASSAAAVPAPGSWAGGAAGIRGHRQEPWVRKRRLNVFGSNAGAQALYRSLGFVTTSISMQKNLLQNGAA